MARMMRHIAERLSRGMVLRRRLPLEVGGAVVYVSPDSQLKYLKPGRKAFDESLLRLAIEHVAIDSIVWDVGANVGIFAFAAAGVAQDGQVLAIEADLWLAQLLRRSAANGCNARLNVNVVCAAAADRTGVSEFVIAMRGRASNYLASAGGWSQAGGARERSHVATLTLDSLLEVFKAPTFVKIDVEGAEALVLRGATQMLNKVRPSIYIEVGQENAAAVSNILTDAGYLLYDSNVPVERQRPLARCVTDTLAIPNANLSPSNRARW